MQSSAAMTKLQIIVLRFWTFVKRIICRCINSLSSTEVDLDLYEQAFKNDDKYPLEECCKMIEDVIEDSIIRLFTSIDNFLFQDIDYGVVVGCMPKWVCDEGIDPEGTCPKEHFEKLRSGTTHPIFNLFIYHYDLWSKVSAIQDRLSAVTLYLRQLYDIVPCVARYSSEEYTSGSRMGGERETEAYVQLNGIFVAYASVFDILTKIAIEQYEFDKYDWNNYKKMRCNGCLYNHSIKNVDSTLKQDGMLFSAPLIVRKFETFRNKYVHEGPWDLRFSIYYTAVKGEPADVVMYSPDMDEFGNFIKSGSRNKFYSQNNRINFQLPDMIKEVTQITKNTIDQLAFLYQQNTTRKVNSDYTQECLDVIKAYY